MRRLRSLSILALPAAVLSTALGLPAVAVARDADVVPDGYIVVYNQDVPSVNGETDALEQSQGFRSQHRYGHALKGFSARLSPGQLKKVQADPAVAYVMQDRYVHAVDAVPLAANEPLPPTGIRRIAAADATTARPASTVNVAVIDTGIDLTHPDLNAVAGTNCITPGAAPIDDHGHGSHVSGIIAGRNNGSGVVGVAPDTKVWAVKVLNAQGSGTVSQVVCGIDWATSTRTDSDPNNNISVANMSLGGTSLLPIGTCSSTFDAEYAAVCRSTQAGITYVVAAGNNGWDFDYASQPDVPAAYPEALTVTAVSDSDGSPGGTGGPPACRTVEVDDRYAGFSSYALTSGGAAHTIAAPGVCIYSTYKNGGYTTFSGTSMATPHMTGVVALCLGEQGTATPACAGLSPAQIIQKLRSDAQAHTAAVPTYGFTGDPAHPFGSRYYGYLTWAGGSFAGGGGGGGGGGPPPPPPPAKDYAATAYDPVTGSIVSGTSAVSRLASNDGVRVEVNSVSTLGSYVAEIQPHVTIAEAPSAVTKLTVTVDGNVSRSNAYLNLDMYNFSTNSWENVVAIGQGATSDTTTTWTASSPQNYVSPSGEVRAAYWAQRLNGTFRLRTDWVKFHLEY